MQALVKSVNEASAELLLISAAGTPSGTMEMSLGDAEVRYSYEASSEAQFLKIEFGKTTIELEEARRSPSPPRASA